MRDFLDYSARVFGQWRSLFGAFTFVLTAVTIASAAGISTILPTWLWGVILIVTMYLGTYRIYLGVVEQLPHAAHLKIEKQSIQFGGRGWSAVLPTQPIRALADLELRNEGAERANVFNFEVTRCEMNTPLFTCKPHSVKLYGMPPHSSPHQQLSFPLDLPGRDWRVVRIEIEADLNETDPRQFVSKVRDLSSYDLDIQCKYKDMDGEVHTIDVSIGQSFEGFRKAVLQNLLQRKNHEMINILSGVLPAG